MPAPSKHARARVWRLLGCTIAITGAVLAAELPRAVTAQTVDHPGFEVETVVSGLDEPTAFDFLGPDEFFVLERASGRVQWIRDGRRVRTVLHLPVDSTGRRGALGLVLAPDFTTTGGVYLYYSAADAGRWVGNRLVRATFNGNRLVRPRVLLEFPRDVQSIDIAALNGGALRFGPDGMLYGQVGSLGIGAETARVEQNLTGAAGAGAGGIFRVDGDGRTPSDNPFVDLDDALAPWFAYGFRDGYGLGFDPVSGLLWFLETGPGIYDEINRAPAGTNSGWLKIIGPDGRDAIYPANGNRPHDRRDLVRLPGSRYRDPMFSWARSPGLSGLVFVDTDAYGAAMRDQLLVGTGEGDLYRFALRPGPRRKRLKLSGSLQDRVADPADAGALALWGSGFGAIQDLRLDPGGILHVSDRAGGRILRVVERGTPVDPTATYVVTFDALWSATTHPDAAFPDNPHFSGLIGTTHDANASFFAVGEPASDGIENMAENGSKTPLDIEIAAARAAGTAQNLLSGGGVATSPGPVSYRFEITASHPRVTLVSMLAPSPDWFVGVSGLSLLQGGDWVDGLAVDLFPYDAGTDSGVSFASPDADTIPRAPVSRIAGSPFLVAGTVPRVGVFTFRRQR